MKCPNCGLENANHQTSIWEGGGSTVWYSDECREIARLKAEVAEQKSEVRRLQGMLMAWPQKPVPTLTRDAAVRGEGEG